MQKYIVLEKAVGQTPLQCAESWRSEHPEFASAPLAYAGRLDPLASGKLLVLIGDECKRQAEYHNLDKRYEIEVVFGLGSDTGDVMGLLTPDDTRPSVTETDLRRTLTSLTGDIELPYPVFSAKTVQGKPLHTWAMEGRLDEITIPTKRSTIYTLTLSGLTTINANDLHNRALEKINSIPPVTESRKALGNDFRRSDIRQCWNNWLAAHKNDRFPVATITCTASSGTYMRTLANTIASHHNTRGLALSIHRTKIGHFQPLSLVGGFWRKNFT